MVRQFGSLYKSKALSDVNLTNLIDVCLVTLIMFILIAPVLEQGITVKLPSTSTKQMKYQEAVTISVSADKKIYLGNSLVSIPELEDRLRMMLATNVELPLILRADKNLPYELIVRILDVIQKSGGSKLGLATKIEIVK